MSVLTVAPSATCIFLQTVPVLQRKALWLISYANPCTPIDLSLGIGAQLLYPLYLSHPYRMKKFTWALGISFVLFIIFHFSFLLQNENYRRRMKSVRRAKIKISKDLIKYTDYTTVPSGICILWWQWLHAFRMRRSIMHCSLLRAVLAPLPSNKNNPCAASCDLHIIK